MDTLTVMALIDWGKYVPSIIYLVGSGGLLAAIVTLLKLRPEAGQITVTAAQGAVIVQTGVIDNLNKELARVTKENEQLRVKFETEQKERQRLEEVLQDSTEAMEDLRKKLEELEGKLKTLTNRTETLEHP